MTHVLLPALAPPHRAYTIDVVGQALLASACGRSHRTIGADLGVPADTVRDWIRRVRARADRCLAGRTLLLPELPVGEFGDDVEVSEVASVFLDQMEQDAFERVP